MATTRVSVHLDGVGRRFGRTVAIEDVTFDARPGEVLGLLGPNGAGKTTTMRVLTGFLRPSAGTVRVGDVDPVADPVEAKRLVGYMPEASALYRDMTVVRFLRFWAHLRGVPRGEREDRVGRVLRSAGLEGVEDRLVGDLSRGYRQRVGLAQALVHDPPVLVLDEPTAGLDPRQVVEARNLIERLGRKRTVLLSSHLLNEVSQLCKRVVVLDKGKVLAVDDVARLTEAAGGERLEVRVAPDDAERAASVVRRVAGVDAVEVQGDVLVVVAGAGGRGQGASERVAGALVGAGIGLVELRRTGAVSLEEAYLRLVRE